MLAASRQNPLTKWEEDPLKALGLGFGCVFFFFFGGGGVDDPLKTLGLGFWGLGFVFGGFLSGLRFFGVLAF